MAGITIRNLDQARKTRLRAQAAEHRRSMAAEARVGLGTLIRARFAPLGGS